MDPTRIKDLQQIQKDLNDKSVPQHIKRKAEMVKQQILQQSKDDTLKRARAELVRARDAGDTKNAHKISEAISDYSKGRYTK